MLLTLFLSQLCFVLKTSADGVFDIQRNVDTSSVDLTSAILQLDVVNLSACSLQCSTLTECISALYYEGQKNQQQKGICYMFNTMQTVSTNSGTMNANVSYLASVCQPYYTDENCCRGLPSRSCYDNHIPQYKDCQDAFEQGERTAGLYYLRPLLHYHTMKVWCDFDNEHGWIVVQRRLDGSVDFYRNWNSYVEGFGYTDGEYWIGLENLYYATTENRRLNIFLEAHDGETRAANFSSFSIHGADDNYRLQVSGYYGDAGDSFNSAGHNQMEFSTHDRDNDAQSDNCAVKYTGAWWYNSCHHSNLNGLWYAGGTTLVFAKGATWNTWKGQYYSYKTIIMRVTRP